MLDDLADLIATCKAHEHKLYGQYKGTFSANEIYCPGCGAPRRVRIQMVHSQIGPYGFSSVDDDPTQGLAKQLAPALFRMVCLQDCGTSFTALVFQGPEGFEVAVF